MTRIPHHLLRSTACLAGGLVALGLILVGAVGSAVLAGGLTLAPSARRLRSRRVAPRTSAPSLGRVGRGGGLIPVRRRLVICALGALAVAAPALANVAGPDDSPAQAYPLQPGVLVSGPFTRSDDVDYLSFKVTAPNTAVHFTVTNSVSSCGSPDGPAGCAVWGTLIDRQERQLGGEGSSAGTGEVDAGMTDDIDWRIADPGTYYLALDSGGSLPSYSVRLDPPAPTGPVITLLSARSVLHGTAVRMTVRTGRPLRSLTAKLTLLRHGKSIVLGRTALSDVAQGSSTLKLTVNRTGRRALARAAGHRLRVSMKLSALPAVGRPATVRRSVTLHR